MKPSSKYLLLFWISFFLATAVASDSYAEEFFADDFESGDVSTGPSPIWKWNDKPTLDSVETSMMYGENDVYQVTADRPYRGTYSLRLNFSGRNSWCNICGSFEKVLTETEAQSGCFNSSVNEFEPYVFNKSNGFSRWRVTSSAGSQICMDSDNAVGPSMIANVAPSIAGGDELKVPYRCGVNGSIGTSASRKSDCNKAINYFNNVSSTDIGYGEALARRFYMYIPSVTRLPGITFKLGYTHWRTDGGSVRSVKLKLSVQRGLQLELNAPNSETIVPNIFMEKDEWFYFEEVFTRESSEGAGDARYDLFMGPASAPPAQLTVPVISRSNFNLGRLVDVSMHGNWQHNEDVSGFVYFDDIVLADSYVGPTDYDPAELPAEPIEDLR